MAISRNEKFAGICPIVLVAEELGVAAARDLMEHLRVNYNIESYLYNYIQYVYNDIPRNSFQVVISVGHPTHNKLSEELIHHCKPWEDDPEIYVYVGDRKAVIFGYGKNIPKLTRAAVKIFIKYYLEDFLDSCQLKANPRHSNKPFNYKGNQSHLTWDEVRQSFINENNLNIVNEMSPEEKKRAQSNRWALDLLEKVNNNFFGWINIRLDIDKAKKIILLPYHTHGKGERPEIALIPKEGMLLGELADKLRYESEVERFRRRLPECFRSVTFFNRQSNFGMLYLCAGIPDPEDITYKHLRYRPGNLIHIDGLHRLMGMVYPVERRDVVLNCYVAVR